MKAIESFSYSPEVNYAAVNLHDSEAIISALKPFITKDIFFFIEIHLITADALRKYISSREQVTLEIRNTFLNKLKNIDYAISQIILTGENLQHEVFDDSIKAKAYKHYYREFEGTAIDNKKINFLKILSLYEIIKFHNYNFMKHWKSLKNIFGEIEIYGSNHSFLEQVLRFKIYPRLELVSLVDLLVRRIGFILRISKETMKETNCIASGTYTSAINYSFSNIFDPKITESIIELNELDTGDNNKKEKKLNKHILKSWKEAIGSCFVDELTIDCRCDEVFNQGQFQIMQINSYSLQIEEVKINKSVYMETNVGIETKRLHRQIVRSLITKVPVEEKIEKYNFFLEELFTLKMSSMMVHFPILNLSEQGLFLYHFSPTYFFRVILNHMKESGVGFIHRFVNKEIIRKELPVEYIKFLFALWWDNNIYKKNSRLNKNSKEKYNKFSQMLANLWEKDKPQIITKINENAHARRAFEMHNLNILKVFLESKLSNLFYLLYVRFLGQDFIYYQKHHYKKI